MGLGASARDDTPAKNLGDHPSRIGGAIHAMIG
jgi:hypothetical protein